MFMVTSGEKSSDIMSQGIGPKPENQNLMKEHIIFWMITFTDGEHRHKEGEGDHRQNGELVGERRVMLRVRDVEIHS